MNIIEWPTWEEYLATLTSQVHNAAYYAVTHTWTIIVILVFVLLTVSALLKDYGHFTEYDDPAPYLESDEEYGYRIGSKKHH